MQLARVRSCATPIGGPRYAHHASIRVGDRSVLRCLHYECVRSRSHRQRRHAACVSVRGGRNGRHRGDGRRSREHDRPGSGCTRLAHPIRYLDWRYLSGTTTPPATGMSDATIAFQLPVVAGQYEFRLFANNGWQRLASSSVVIVNPSAIQIAVNGIAAPDTATERPCRLRRLWKLEEARRQPASMGHREGLRPAWH